MLFLVLFIFVFATLYLLSGLLSARQQLAALKIENAEYKQSLQQYKQYRTSVQSEAQNNLKMKVAELQIQQNVASAAAQNLSSIGISAKESVPSPNKKTLSFWVEGPELSLFDAMDLALVYSNIKESPVCVTGDVFSQYPRVESEPTYLAITGIADIGGEKIITGAINKQFASCTFEKMDASQPAKIELDPSKTHVFFLGKSVLDLEKSFKEIIW